MTRYFINKYTAPIFLFIFSSTHALAQSLSAGSDKCDPGKLCNPLKSTSIEQFILNIIDILLVFAQPIIILFIMYAGYLFVTAQGDAGKVQDAKNALLWAVVGGVIILGARVIIGVIEGTVAGLGV